MATPGELAAIIGFDVDGRGFKQANNQLDDHLRGWERVEASTARIGANVDRMVSRFGALAGVVGVGKLVADLAQIDTVASRAALSVDALGGRSAFAPFQHQILGAARATSQDPRELGASLLGVQGRVGGIGGSSNWGRLGNFLGKVSLGYGIDVQALGDQTATLLQAQKLGPGATQQMLTQLANQAARSGQSGQMGQYLGAVTMATGLLGSAHPGQMRAGASNNLGAMYGAVTSVNPSFKDPSLFAQGVGGLDAGITSAYQNPRLAAAMQMAGIGYWDQRGGLAGPHGRQTASKLLRYADRTYGRGSIEEDLFFRSNFGDVSADMARALAKGTKTYDQLMRPGDPKRQPGGSIDQRARSGDDTANAIRNRAEAQGQDWLSHIYNPLAGIADSIGLTGLLGGIAGYKGARWLGSKALRALRGRGAAATLEEAAGAGASAASSAARGGAGLLGRLPGLLRKVPELGFGASEDIGKLSPKQQREVNRLMWKDTPFISPLPGIENFAQGILDDVGGGGRSKSHQRADKTFERSVDKFDQTVRKLLGDLGPHRKGASYSGGAGGSMNPAGLQGPNDAVGANMVLARMLAPAGGAGGASTSPASWSPSGGGGSGGGGGGAGATSGAGWQDGTATMYNPALGGINGKVGGGAWAGHPISGSEWGCAADAKFAFGTRIEIAFGGKSTTVTVMDRGPGVHGNHFDLLPGPARYLGIGNSPIKWRAAGGGAGATTKSKSSGASGGGGSSGGGGGGGGSSSSGGGGTVDVVKERKYAHPDRPNNRALGGNGPHAVAAAWMGGSAPPVQSMLGGGDHIVVNVDGMAIERRNRLTRGKG